MKKIILSTVLLSATFLGSAQIASAEQIKQTETPVGIEFESAGPGVEGPYKGVLTLPFKPSALEFGKYKATGAQISAPAINIGEGKDKEWLVVNDDRDNPGPIAGADKDSFKGGTWKLTATMAELSDGKTVIPATLDMDFDEIKEYEIGDTKSEDGLDIVPNDPNDGGVKGPLAEEHQIELTPTLKLESGQTDEMVIMKKGVATEEKVGAATELKASNLVVQPNKDYKGGKLTSKITWTLSTGL